MIRFTCFIPALLVVARVGAQPQLENPSFEAWDNAGQATQEPQQWSSLKTSDGGVFINSLVPQLCWRSTDARTGQYSVNLRTVNSTVGAANGLLTNGRVHAELNVANSYMYTVQDNEQWRTAMSSRPDSLVGWFKATPQPGDRANVGALLHVNEGRLPAFGTEGNYVAGASWKAPFGNVGEWTRFSTPFQYLNEVEPQWILLILTAGDSAGSQVGTQAWFEDLALIYNVQCEPNAQSVAPGEAFVVDYSTGGVPTGPVSFSVELSDANGDFGAPVVIGSVVSNSLAGSIPCAIPAGTSSGNGYAIRVVADSPFYVPVGCSLEVDLQSGIMERAQPWLIADDAGRFLIDGPFGGGTYALHDAQGRLLSEGRLQTGRNTISTDHRGLITVVLRHTGALYVDRLLLLR
ncbi:MAG: hypothetical protein IPJ85_15460 [Flavobacteriales bacterium]|nr:hypothetical protein [Flavobacteriales bacterium]